VSEFSEWWLKSGNTAFSNAYNTAAIAWDHQQEKIDALQKQLDEVMDWRARKTMKNILFPYQEKISELGKKLADANALINETQLYYMEQIKRVEDVQQRLINMYEKEKRDLEKKLVDARETLSFYADRSNWRYSGNDRFDNNICHKDSSKVKTGNTVDTVGGKHARECLRRLEEK
jgi:DNA repair exonuclease SbcCD ATPase subunit